MNDWDVDVSSEVVCAVVREGKGGMGGWVRESEEAKVMTGSEVKW